METVWSEFEYLTTCHCNRMARTRSRGLQRRLTPSLTAWVVRGKDELEMCRLVHDFIQETSRQLDTSTLALHTMSIMGFGCSRGQT
jgi:hypothetical protein